MAKGRHARSRSFAAVAVVASVAALLFLVAGGAAFAGFRYEDTRADRLLPGVSVAGVDVGGMTWKQARRAVRQALAPSLDRRVTVRVGDERWVVTPAEMGRRADVAAAIDQAFATADGLGTLERAWMRFREESAGVTLSPDLQTRGDGIEALAQRIAEDVFVPARPASMGITDDSEDVVFVKAKAGAKLDQVAAAEAIAAALEGDAASVRLETVRLAPKVTEATLGPTIVIRLNENKIYLYDGFDVVESWSVATGKPGFDTPTGVWNIWDMRENPTWYNPALDGWGAGLPAVVPGGPGNPMGTRAIYIDAPGLIRIHGTTDDSSIGRYASHGCIRMHNEEIEALFERIPVGAHVIIVGHRPPGADYWDSPPSADI